MSYDADIPSLEDFELLIEDDNNSSHAEMIIKAMGAFAGAIEGPCIIACKNIQDFEMTVVFRDPELNRKLIEGSKTLGRFNDLKPDSDKDLEAYWEFCNMLNKEATTGEIMVACINVMLDHVTGDGKKPQYGVMTNPDIPVDGPQVIFCFKNSTLYAQIAQAQKMLDTIN